MSILMSRKVWGSSGSAGSQKRTIRFRTEQQPQGGRKYTKGRTRRGAVEGACAGNNQFLLKGEIGKPTQRRLRKRKRNNHGKTQKKTSEGCGTCRGENSLNASNDRGTKMRTEERGDLGPQEEEVPKNAHVRSGECPQDSREGRGGMSSGARSTIKSSK